jgi:HK97 family phage prohead protease
VDFPRDNLTRQVTFRAEPSSDGRTLEGYAAVFNTPTRIDSYEGFFDEQIAPGAFTKTISERTPVLQFDHGHHPLVGSIPIGAIDALREDSHGLHVRARLHDNWLVEPVRDAIREGSISGMSFRFSVVKETIDENDVVPMRTVNEVKLYELGPVVWPAYEATSVGVRSRFADILDDPEARAELARALLLGTSLPAAGSTTADEAATDMEPPTHSGLSDNERARVLSLLEIK